MKNIGIMTFHASHNYGSVLQAYALQRTVAKIESCNCEIINFANPSQAEMYSILYKNNSLKNILRNIRVLLYKYRIRRNRKQDFDKFINHTLRLGSKKYSSINELEVDKLPYNTLICGSDQIWNVGIKDFDYAYYLPFIQNIKKIAYAPSFGGHNPFKDLESKKKVEKYLEDFFVIAAREKVGQEILKEITMKDISLVVDPTLLLEKQEWDVICSDRIIKEDYIFFYSIDYNDDVVKMVKVISKKLNLPVVVLFTTPATFNIMFDGFKMSQKQSPGDFISLIKNAKLVLSNSFHGNVFSIIYRKPFYILRGTYNGAINSDNRLTTLLQKFDIKDREINIHTVENFNISLDINYSKSEEFLLRERNASMNFLKNAINN